MNNRILVLALLAFINTTAFSASPTYEQELADLSRDFQVASYDTEDVSARTKMLDGLLVKATDLKTRNPERGMPYAWIGWLKFTALYAQTDPAAMMPLIQDARTNLEKAIEIEPNCCGSTAYVSLALIYQIPLTGKDQSATVRMYFDKAFALEPNGLVPHTRYAGYLMRAGDYENALNHANAALVAPPLANRPSEDRAVRQQAQDFIEQITDRMKRAKAASAQK